MFTLHTNACQWHWQALAAPTSVWWVHKLSLMNISDHCLHRLVTLANVLHHICLCMQRNNSVYTSHSRSVFSVIHLLQRCSNLGVIIILLFWSDIHIYHCIMHMHRSSYLSASIGYSNTTAKFLFLISYKRGILMTERCLQSLLAHRRIHHISVSTLFNLTS